MARRNFAWLAMAALAGAASAQTVVDPAATGDAARAFDATVSPPLACKADPLKPALNFALRFQTGYMLSVPLNLYKEGKHHWDVTLLVTPRSGNRERVYLTDSTGIANVRRDGIAEITGTFLVGEGRYEVKASLRDDGGRVCRKEWEVEAKNVRKEPVLMPSNTVGDLSWHSTASPNQAAYPRRVTVVVNAALPRAARVSSQDQKGEPSLITARWTTVVSMVGALVERLAAAAVRMVVINLDQQRELLRQEDFGLDGMVRVSHAADGLEQWSVDYRVLQNPAGAWDLLAGLVNGELRASEVSDVVVFVGLPWRTRTRMPASFPDTSEGPRFFYLQYRVGLAPGLVGPEPDLQGRRGGQRGGPPPGARPIEAGNFAQPADTIELSMRRLKGKTFAVYTPADLNKAIQEIASAGK